MTPQRTLTTRTWIELFVLAVIWGAVFLAVRLAIDEVPIVTSFAHHVFWAAVILWAFVLVRGLPVPRDPKIWQALIVMGVLNNAIPFSLMAWGQLHIQTGLTLVFNAGTAIFGVLIAALILADERLTTRKIIGSAIGFFGVATAIRLESVRNFDITSVAQLAVIAGTISYAFAGVWARINLTGLPPQVAAAGMLTGSSLEMVPAALLIDCAPSFELSVTALGAIGYYVVFATGARICCTTSSFPPQDRPTR